MEGAEEVPATEVVTVTVTVTETIQLLNIHLKGK